MNAPIDPAELATKILSMSGLEAMQRLIAGELQAPSMASTLGFALTEVSDGRAVFEGDPSARVLNPLGIVHGGWALTLIDSACGCAGHTTLPAGVGYTTLETKVNFVRAITVSSGRVRVEGVTLARGRTIITTEAKAIDSAGKMLAHGTSTLLVMQKQDS